MIWSQLQNFHWRNIICFRTSIISSAISSAMSGDLDSFSYLIELLNAFWGFRCKFLSKQGEFLNWSWIEFSAHYSWWIDSFFVVLNNSHYSVLSKGKLRSIDSFSYLIELLIWCVLSFNLAFGWSNLEHDD